MKVTHNRISEDVDASLIICTREVGGAFKAWRSFNNDYLELIEVSGASSMGEGYNAGIAWAHSNTLIFTHDDVRCWASAALYQRLTGLLSPDIRADIGFLGVAGSCVFDTTAAWWGKGPLRGAVAHSQNNQEYMSMFGPYGDALVMDGVLLACRRAVLDKTGPFVEDGWHFYDIDITLRAALMGYTNKVVPFPIYHGSVGPIGSEWHELGMSCVQRFASFLPVTLPDIAQAQKKYKELYGH